MEQENQDLLSTSSQDKLSQVATDRPNEGVGMRADGQDSLPCFDSLEAIEPPFSADGTGAKPRQIGSAFHMLPCQDVSTAARWRSASYVSPKAFELGVSPLTASSLQVMQREYNRDTWRMYNRISAARIRQLGSNLIPPKDEWPTTTDAHDSLQQTRSMEVVSDDASQQGESEEAIFDLDFEMEAHS